MFWNFVCLTMTGAVRENDRVAMGQKFVLYFIRSVHSPALHAMFIIVCGCLFVCVPAPYVFGNQMYLSIYFYIEYEFFPLEFQYFVTCMNVLWIYAMFAQLLVELSTVGGSLFIFKQKMCGIGICDDMVDFVVLTKFSFTQILR